MKHTFILITALLCMATAAMADDVLLVKSGSETTEMLLNNEPSMTIGETITVTDGTTTKSYSASQRVVLAVKPVTYTVDINAYGFGTYSCSKPVEITGAKVYKATLTGTVIKCTEIESAQVPAGEGVILYKEGTTEATTATATVISSADVITDNGLVATTTATGDLAAYESSLVLSGNTFVTFSGTEFTANKAYFPYTAGQAKTFTIVFDNTPTAVSTVVEAKTTNGAAYNILGQKVSPNAKGLIIINGKKMYNK